MNKKEFIERYGIDRYLAKLESYHKWYNENKKKERTEPTPKERRELEIKTEEEATLQFLDNYKGDWVSYYDCIVLDNGDIYRRGGLHTCCTNKGRKLLKRFRLVKQSKMANGYLSCVCGCRQDYVHIHIWKAFNGEIPSGYEIDHIDTDPHNNALNNLKLVSRKDNISNPLTLKHLAYANQIKGYKRYIRRLERENKSLRKEISSFLKNNC